MSLKPRYRSETKEQEGSNYAVFVSGGASGVQERTRQDEVEVKGGSHNDVQEDAGRDLDQVNGEDGNRGKDLELTTEVFQQFGDAILKRESPAPLELEYKSMVSTPAHVVWDETADRKGFSMKDLPRGARAKMLGEEVERYLGPVKGDDRNMAKDLDLTTSQKYFSDASINGKSQASSELESRSMISTPDLLGGLSLKTVSPILQQEQAENDEKVGGELPTDTKDLPQQLVDSDSQDMPILPEEVVLNLFKFMKPEDILSASQTCQLWRSLGENDKLWEQKCKEAGLANSLTTANKKALDRLNENTIIAYSAWKESFLKPYKIERKFRERVPHVITVEMSRGVNKMEIFNEKIVTTFGTNLYVFCAFSGELLHELVGHNSYVAAFKMDDLFIVSGSHNGSVKVWDVDTGSCLHTLLGHTDGVTFLQMHGTIAVSGSCDTNTLQVWDVREGICLKTLRHHTDWVRGSGRGHNMEGAQIVMLRGRNERVRHIQFDGRFVVSGSEDNTIKIWDLETGECLGTLHHSSTILFLKLNGVDVVAGYNDGSIKVWDVSTGVCQLTLRLNCSHYMELRGETLVCGGGVGTTAKIWNLSTGACLHTVGALNEHRRAISGIGVNDKLLVTSSRDGTVKLWDIKTGEFIRDMLVLESGGSVEKMKMEEAKIVCVVKSNKRLKLLMLDFDTNNSD